MEESPVHKVVYLFSGLGADQRVFKRLTLPGYQHIHIQWSVPEQKQSIVQYARVIREQVISESPILIGLSFGGIIATEIARLIPQSTTIIISSAKTDIELGWSRSFFFRLRLYKLMPALLFKRPHFIIYYLFGATEKADKKLLREILADTDVGFLKWAFQAMGCWQNYTVKQPIFHIHGTADHIIPYERVRADYTVTGGGHFMIFNRAEEISAIIHNFLLTLHPAN